MLLNRLGLDFLKNIILDEQYFNNLTKFIAIDFFDLPNHCFINRSKIIKIISLFFYFLYNKDVNI